MNKLKFIGFYDYTVILTYISLASAVSGIILASRGACGTAIFCLLLSGICDAFDGMVARSKPNRTADEKAFGIQLDSLCDVVSFGIFPAFLCYCMGVRSIPGILLICCYSICAVIRLAFFNVMEEKRQQTEGGCNKVYRGLPVTSISIIFPIISLLRFVFPEALYTAVLYAMLAVVAFLFILDFPIRKIDLAKFFSRK